MSMKRRNLFAALFGVGAARAQQWKQCVPSKEYRDICSDETKPALNNQCPVCGTMADPWKRETFKKSKMEYTDVPHGPTEHIARCKRCNAAFWQDAEK